MTNNTSKASTLSPRPIREQKSSPHQRSANTTQRIMLDVIISLMPALIVGVVMFGWYSLLLSVICVAVCFLSEQAYQLIRKQPINRDLSCIVTGLIFALNLPSLCPWYFAVIGSVFAIIVVKMFFGGIGKNFANPAATARVFLMLAYASLFGSYADNRFELVSSATYLTGGAEALSGSFAGISGYWANVLQVFVGATRGCIGEVSALAILLGGAYLIIRKVIDWRIPVVILLTCSVLTVILYGDVSAIPLQLFSGGLMFGAFFMATDYSTSPKSHSNRVFYSIGIAFITMIIRKYGAYPDGVCVAILVMNLFVPVFDKYIKPIRMGQKTKSGKLKIDFSSYTAYSLCLLMALSLVVLIPLGIGGVL